MTNTLPANDPIQVALPVGNSAGYIYVASGGGPTSGGLAVLGVGSDAVVTDSNGVKYAYPQVKLGYGANKGNTQSIWTSAAVAAGGSSALQHTYGAWGKLQIAATASAATNITLEVSPDGGTTWCVLAQDNAGTPWTLALTAGQLSGARDLPGIVADAFRLVSSAAATITAYWLSIAI